MTLTDIYVTIVNFLAGVLVARAAAAAAATTDLDTPLELPRKSRASVPAPRYTPVAAPPPRGPRQPELGQ